MPLITAPSQVEDIFAEAREHGVCLANFGTSNQYTTQAILRAAWEFERAHGMSGVPIIVSATANYPIEPQLVSYTPLRDARFGARALIRDVELLLSEHSPYAGVRVMLHLDHGQPERDRTLIPEILEQYATVMYDASSLPLAENIRRTAEFVERYGGLVQVEGAVTEIVQAESQIARDAVTTPDEAERFWRTTGVVLLVPNLGTEHRATTPMGQYDSRAARAISARVGKRLVLHGSSSVPDAALGTLADDGIIKLNVWTVFERIGGQAVARFILRQLGNVFSADELASLRREGWLGERYFGEEYRMQTCGGTLAPKLSGLREEHRREVWQATVVARMKFYLDAFRYIRFRRAEGP